MTMEQALAKGWKITETLMQKEKNGCELHRVTLKKGAEDVRGHGSSQKEATANAISKIEADK